MGGEERTRKGWEQKERRRQVSTAGKVPLMDILWSETCAASKIQSSQLLISVFLAGVARCSYFLFILEGNVPAWRRPCHSTLHLIDTAFCWMSPEFTPTSWDMCFDRRFRILVTSWSPGLISIMSSRESTSMTSFRASTWLRSPCTTGWKAAGQGAQLWGNGECVLLRSLLRGKLFLILPDNG